MTEEERSIINQFYFSEISKELFLEFYPVDFKKDKEHIFLSVKSAYEARNSGDLDLALTLIIFDTDIVDADRFVELLCLLLRETWHQQHENITRILQEIKSPKSIDTLYQTALTKFDYLDYDDSIPLAIKCIHALGDINTAYAKEKLQLLASSENSVIKEKAEKQLYYYKK